VTRLSEDKGPGSLVLGKEGEDGPWSATEEETKGMREKRGKEGKIRLGWGHDW